MMTSCIFFEEEPKWRREVRNGYKYRGLIPLSGVVFVALPTLIGDVVAHDATTEKIGIKNPTLTGLVAYRL
ncbi:hypothetical protein ACN78_06325 [Escherichia coli]|nr:hypothetical protein [Escherichia coli]EAA9230086.1 hypothetical protein [Salmonella enterica]EEV9999765.1 hypothetical protein [Escherichia coli]EFN7859061.1 hypothetical protein [Escherichia coli]EFN9854859.1 hypothetical protein [Escherichia coli]